MAICPFSQCGFIIEVGDLSRMNPAVFLVTFVAFADLARTLPEILVTLGCKEDFSLSAQSSPSSQAEDDLPVTIGDASPYHRTEKRGYG
jgi:hypothetical protein